MSSKECETHRNSSATMRIESRRDPAAAPPSRKLEDTRRLKALVAQALAISDELNLPFVGIDLSAALEKLGDPECSRVEKDIG